MKTLGRIAIVIGIIIGVYVVFYYQNDINSFVKNITNKPTDTTVDEEKEDLLDKVVGNKDNDGTVVFVQEEEAVIKLVEESSPAVVSILRSDVVYDYYQGPVVTQDSIGTGFIVDGERGIIFTNKHVVSDESVTYSAIIGEEEKEYEVTNISRDPVNDFAILKIDPAGEKLPELPLGNSDQIKVGQTVVAIGNALGQFGNSVTKGVVSGLSRGIVAQSGYMGDSEFIEDVIQTDAALNPGNSGGPLINLKGEVIGINVAVSSGAENIGFAIPIDVLKPVIDGFNEKGQITRPFMGVSYREYSKEIAEQRQIPLGALVDNVLEGSPAEKAGLKAGDLVLYVNGVKIDNEATRLGDEILKYKPGDTVTLTIDRNGREMEVQVQLDEQKS